MIHLLVSLITFAFGLTSVVNSPHVLPKKTMPFMLPNVAVSQSPTYVTGADSDDKNQSDNQKNNQSLNQNEASQTQKIAAYNVQSEHAIPSVSEVAVNNSPALVSCSEEEAQCDIKNNPNPKKQNSSSTPLPTSVHATPTPTPFPPEPTITIHPCPEPIDPPIFPDKLALRDQRFIGIIPCPVYEIPSPLENI